MSIQNGLRTCLAVLSILGMCLLAGCDDRPRYTVMTGSPAFSHILFRVDQKTGEVCTFRWYQNKTPVNEITGEGFMLVGCANSKSAN